MDSFVIEGGKRLSGTIQVNGSKNAALPILAVSLMTAGRCTFRNLPLIREGGFIPAIDHSVPSDVSFDTYRYYIDSMQKALAMV